jgi:uncharacterized protein (TIGR03067 family)
VSGQELGLPCSAGGQTTLPVRVATLDPLQRIREVKVDVWTGPPGAAPPAGDREPETKPGDGARRRIAAAITDGTFTAEVPLPPLPAGQVYYVQPLMVNTAGVVQWAAGQAVPFDPALVLERKPAQLEFKPPTGPIERTLRMSNNNTLTIFQGQETVSMSLKVAGYVLESLQPETGKPMTSVRLTLTRPTLTRERQGKSESAPPAIGAYTSRYSPQFSLAGNHQAKGVTKPILNGVPLLYRESVQQVFETVCNAWEATTLPLPNRLVQPQETWSAAIPTLVTIRGKKEVRRLHVTCTFEGLRTINGRPQGYIRLAGEVRGSGKRASEVLGKVTGHALIDVEGGFLTQVRTTNRFEVDTGDAEFRLLVTDENTVDREPGNTRGITRPTVVAAAPRVDLKAPPEVVKPELARLQGKWKMVKMETNGRDDPNVDQKGVLIDGADYSFLFNGRKSGLQAKISLDPSTTPPSINLTSGLGTQLGIYRFTEDGELQICLNQARGEGSDKRPTRFTTKPDVGAGSVLCTLEPAEKKNPPPDATKPSAAKAPSAGKAPPAAAVPGAKPRKAEAVKADLAKMEGKWKMVKMETNGRDDPNVDEKGVLIDGADYSFLLNGKKSGFQARIYLDPTLTPRTINLVSSQGTQLGIYQFTEEGELQICLNQAQSKGSDRRPTKFTTKEEEGAGSILYTMKSLETRTAPGEGKPPPAVKVNKKAVAKKELGKLQGRWKMAAMEHDGRDDPLSDQKGVLIVGTAFQFVFNGMRSGLPSKIYFDPTTTPRSFSLVSGGGTQLGIYRFTEDGELQICLNQAQGKGSDKRPTKFTTKPEVGAGSILYTLKKE